MVRHDEVEVMVQGIPGHADRVYLSGYDALVIDFKTGRNPVEKADVNLQLAHYAVGVAYKWEVKRVYCAIVQPYAGEPVVAEYGPEDLLNAESEIGLIVRRTEENPVRTPGVDQCRYCRANGTAACSESRESLTELAAIGEMKMDIGSFPKNITPLEAKYILDQATLAEKTIERIRTAAKAALAAGIEIPGYRLKPGKKRTTIDPKKAWTQLGDHLKAESFQDCLMVHKGSLEDLLKRTGIPWSMLEPAITETRDQPCLERVK